MAEPQLTRVTKAPAPSEWAQHWYIVYSGAIFQADNYPSLQQLRERMRDEDDGVPQLKVVGEHVPQACIVQVNQIAKNNPAVAERIGHDGLMRMMFACVAEAQGLAPRGYLQSITSELVGAASRFYKDPLFWASVAVAGGVGYWLLRRRRRR